MAKRKYLIAYHGTTRDPKVIAQQGLIPPNLGNEARFVLSQYYHRKIPKWCYKAITREIKYRRDGLLHHGEGPFVHLTFSWRQALAYTSATDGEFRESIHHIIRSGLRLKRKPQGKYAERRYIVTVRIPITKEIEAMKERIRSHGYKWREMRQEGGWDEKVKHVPPHDILKIEEVSHLFPFGTGH